VKSRRLIRMGGVELRVSVDDGIARRARAVRERARRLLAGAAGGERASAPVAAAPSPRSPEEERLRARIQSVEWYHSIELAAGVVTPGFFDHRQLVPQYGLPADLSGRRVLDVATYNGFWAFEFEKRGAAEVVALDIETFADIDLSPVRRAQMSPAELGRKVGAGFEIAREALGSKVRREPGSVYELSPARFGMFDLVFCGDLLVHLSNPIRALQAIRSVTAGTAVLCEMYDSHLDEDGDGRRLLSYLGGRNDYVWWMFGRRTLESMIHDAGFARVELLRSFNLVPTTYGGREAPPHAVFHATP
jgi:tRNA (mo5U34)-methyltransferase